MLSSAGREMQMGCKNFRANCQGGNIWWGQIVCGNVWGNCLWKYLGEHLGNCLRNVQEGKMSLGDFRGKCKWGQIVWEKVWEISGGGGLFEKYSEGEMSRNYPWEISRWECPGKMIYAPS